MVTAVRDTTMWQFELGGRLDEKQRPAIRTVERAGGEAVGYLVHAGDLWKARLYVEAYELAPEVSWLAATPSVLRYLRTTGQAYQERPGAARFETFTLSLGADHPAYRAIPDRLPRIHPAYAWYLRVPDLPAFVGRIAPVLETRLAVSVAPGHSGELLLNFYRDGLRLVLAEGRLDAVEAWEPPDEQAGGASFPGLTFLQLLFGYRSLEELEQAFADCRVNSEEARVLLDALFPKQPSRVWPVE